jgi:drug/metabolite transporter (DMT)-like permease
MPTSRSPFLAYLTLALGIAIVSFSAIFVRWAGAPGTVTSFYRMSIAALALAWPYYRRGAEREEMPRLGVRAAILGGLFFAGDLALWTSGVVMSGATNPTPLAMGGAILILGLDTLRATTLGLGTLLGLMAAVFYGGYFLITQRGRQSLDSLSYTWLTTLSASIVLLGVNLVLGHPLIGFPGFSYLNFLALGLVVQVFGWLAINYTQGYLPASIVAPTMLGQPVVTGLWAVFLLGEALSPGQILGGAAVLMGVYIVHRSRHRSPDIEAIT